VRSVSEKSAAVQQWIINMKVSLAALVETWHRLQLNDNKTEMIWFGSRSNLAKLATHQPVAASRNK